MSTPIRGLGALPQPVDRRDVPLELAALPIQHAALPASVDLRPLFPPIHDQGNTNACTAYAVADAFCYQRNKQKLKPVMDDPSHVYSYWFTRVLEGTEGKDIGANIRDAFKALKWKGLVQNKNWPDGVTQIEIDPGQWWKQEATPGSKPPYPLNGVYQIDADPTFVGDHHKLATYRAVPPDVASIRASLANGFAVVFGTSIYESFWNTGPDGIVPIPAPATERRDGGHALCIVGYRTDDKFIVRNSWSSQWGDQGYCFISPEYFQLGITWDFWTHHAAAA